jgi:hypothetical protein
MIRKLRAQMMPPPGSRRPTGERSSPSSRRLEKVMDESAPINPGTRTSSVSIAPSTSAS